MTWSPAARPLLHDPVAVACGSVDDVLARDLAVRADDQHVRRFRIALQRGLRHLEDVRAARRASP